LKYFLGKAVYILLGLAIAKSALEYMDGSISAYNGEKGAVFQLAIPLSDL